MNQSFNSPLKHDCDPYNDTIGKDSVRVIENRNFNIIKGSLYLNNNLTFSKEKFKMNNETLKPIILLIKDLKSGKIGYLIDVDNKKFNYESCNNNIRHIGNVKLRN